MLRLFMHRSLMTDAYGTNIYNGSVSTAVVRQRRSNNWHQSNGQWWGREQWSTSAAQHVIFAAAAILPGAQPRQKSWGGQGLGPNTEALAPYARQKAGLGVGCGRGSPPPPPTVRVRGINPPLRKIFENSNANLHGDYYVMKFLASWKLRPRSWGGGPIRLLHLCYTESTILLQWWTEFDSYSVICTDRV